MTTYSDVSLMIDGAWGNNSINTFDYGYFGPNILYRNSGDGRCILNNQ